MFKNLPAVRAWIYSILTPLGVLLSGYGIITESKWGLWAALITAALNGGVAFTNRPTTAKVAEIQNAALADAISMILAAKDHPEGFPPEVDAPAGETPYVEEG